MSRTLSISKQERFLSRKHIRTGWLLVCAALIGTVAVLFLGRSRGVLVKPVALFHGVTYECVQLPDSREGGKLAHIVQIDLSEPGIELDLTPLDPEAVAEGFQYRLARASQVAADRQLAVLVNGTLFDSQSTLYRKVGDLATSIDTVVARHQVSHVHPHSYLLWFEDDLTPHLEKTKPPSAESLERACWGMGGQGIALKRGKVSRFAGHDPDLRTAIAIDPIRRLLWLAVYEHASEHLAASMLAQRGAIEGIFLDGGGSSTMVLGQQARLATTGNLVGGSRPVANFFGVRARPWKMSEKKSR